MVDVSSANVGCFINRNLDLCSFNFIFNKIYPWNNFLRCTLRSNDSDTTFYSVHYFKKYSNSNFQNDISANIIASVNSLLNSVVKLEYLFSFRKNCSDFTLNLSWCNTVFKSCSIWLYWLYKLFLTHTLHISPVLYVLK